MDSLKDELLFEDTKHSVERAKERAGLNEKRARKMMNLARERGIRSDTCKWSADRNYLIRHSTEDTEAVAYNSFCFIMQRETGYCITILPLPRDFGVKKRFNKENRTVNFTRYMQVYC